MDILYLLVPLSAVLVLAILGVFAWALHRGQFDDLESAGDAVLQADSDHAGLIEVKRSETLSQNNSAI